MLFLLLESIVKKSSHNTVATPPVAPQYYIYIIIFYPYHNVLGDISLFYPKYDLEIEKSFSE